MSEPQSNKSTDDDNEAPARERVIRVYPPTNALRIAIDDDWDLMSEDERQDYIWDCMIESGRLGPFDYEEVPK